MNEVMLTIHRACNEIGGNCIEISAKGERLLLDAGRPLYLSEEIVNKLIPSTLNLDRPVSGVLLSHSHQDHYGMLEALPEKWPVYCGKATECLIRLTSEIFGKKLPQHFNNWDSGTPFQIGIFRITPFLTDHSAFDAYMLLIEVSNCRLLYTGDFRIHGRKSSLVKKMMSAPPSPIDALIMEGTNLGSSKPYSSEEELEQRYINLFNSTNGRVFVAWSAQNIDRTVTLFRACAKKKSDRTMVVDLYTAEVMEMLAKFGKLPNPNWGNIRVVITSSFARMYEKTGRSEFLKRMLPYGISAKVLAESSPKWVIMVRKSLLRDFERNGVIPNSTDIWSWSQWSGYLENGDGAILKDWFESRNCPSCHIHTSGHASPSDLKEFAKHINPKILIPVHSFAWDKKREGFKNILRLTDGEQINLLDYCSTGVTLPN